MVLCLFSQENVEDKKLFRARYWCVFFDSEPQRLRYHLRRQMPGGREFTRHDLGDPPSRSVVSR